MSSPQPEPDHLTDHLTDHNPRSNTARHAAGFLSAIALLYALLAGLHTLQDFDLGWQLATGRWILQHRQLLSTDVFSSTAHGAPWIYPALSGIVFYLAYLAGGYALLSWIGAASCAVTVALLVRRDNVAGSALALVAVPLIANRTQPRAEMFTTVLFAAFLTLLWQHYRSGQERSPDQHTGRSPLWLLPILMVAWVNLHLGFVAGLALCCAYVLVELLDLPFPDNRAAVRFRLQRAWPWLAMTAVATLINPWGARIYVALSRQARAQDLHTLWVVEWEAIRPSWTSLRQALDWRDPQSSFWWLLAIALLCAAIALWRKRLGTAGLLLGAAYFAMQHVRLQALFACVVVVLGGSLLHEVWKTSKASHPRKAPAHSKRPVSIPSGTAWGTRGAALLLLTALLTGLAGVRSWDLITNRYYLRSTQLSLFGTGLSWWFPERAVEFLRAEKLPANVFNTYALGGYLTWRLFPAYPDYIDSRAIPFGPQLFFRAYDLSTEPPDSPAWQQEADARGINTIIVSLARYDGITLFPQIPAFCRGQSWRPVYMDEVSAIFVRRTPQTAALIDRLQIDCDKVSFAPPIDLNAAAFSRKTSRDKADLFNSWANAAGILYSLGRYPEALAYLDRAQAIFSDNAHLHLTRALALEHTGHPAEAEEEFRASTRIEPRDETWLDLGLFYLTQKRYADAVEVFRQSAEHSSRPHDMWMLLGQAYLQINQPEQALVAFDKAVASSPFRDAGESLGAGFNSLIATGRARAWYQLGDVARAVSFQEDAVKLAPKDAKLWLGLADLYDAQGHKEQAGQARLHAAGR
jgi:tetratricopeptide (TPR) repeat protein